MRKLVRARQLSAKSLGVLPWQRDFWLFLTEHVLAKRLGPPDLLKLAGFGAPAITQYTVTTPDLLRSFRRYNAGKPYHRQVRPFGFMVMLQQSDEGEQSTMMRIIAPFNRDPAKAARKAFDRDTGVAARPTQLKSYAHSLEHYHNHPEAKFLNGERGDRGPTHRRHIIAKSVVHIGKEANKLDIQTMAGVDPSAQIEFVADTGKVLRLKAVTAAVTRLGVSRVARQAGLSRKHISSIAAGVASTTQGTLSTIEQAILSAEIARARKLEDVERVLQFLRMECERIGLRQMARKVGMNPGSLSRVASGQRSVSGKLVRRIKLVMPAIT